MPGEQVGRSLAAVSTLPDRLGDFDRRIGLQRLSGTIFGSKSSSTFGSATSAHSHRHQRAHGIGYVAGRCVRSVSLP